MIDSYVIPVTKGRFGNTFLPFSSGLTSNKYWLEIPLLEEYEKRPLTIEAWVKLNRNSWGRQVFLSYGSKNRKTHWEVYSQSGDGLLCAYLPEYLEAPVITGFHMEVGRWYHLALIMDNVKIQLYADALKVMENYITSGPAHMLAEHDQLNFGLIVGGDEGIAGCDGLVDEIRISSVVRDISSVPAEPFEVDAFTLGLWHLDEVEGERVFKDASVLANHGHIGFPRSIALDKIERSLIDAVSPLDTIAVHVSLTSESVDIPSIQSRISLDGKWEMAEEGAFHIEDRIKDEWIDGIPANVPGSVHLALMENGLIPDPAIGHNAAVAKSMSHRTWWFKRRFARPQGIEQVRLSFDGVCTDCEVWVNGQHLGTHKGAFGGPFYDITEWVEEDNTLIVRLFPIPEGSCWTAWQSTVTFNCCYGWHYAKLPSLGIWKSVYLEEIVKVKMERPFIAANGHANAIKGMVSLCTVLESTYCGIHGQLNGIIEPLGFDGSPYYFSQTINSAENRKNIHLLLEIPEARLWWPLDIGEQNLYRLKLAFIPDLSEISPIVYETVFGIRSIEMSPSSAGPHSNEYNWMFVINGRPMFVKGSNWCTMDALMDFSIERYDRFLSLAADQHIQVLRAWGGGIVETDEFYELCDRKGIMVLQEWQTCWDSHFRQPYDAFEETVRLNTIRIRNHPSLVMWCAGNESGLPYGSIIEMMERLSVELDGTRPFHRGDGFGNDHIHIIWEDSPIDRYVNMDNTMLNEFGLASMPNMESMERYMSQKELKIWPQLSGSTFYAHFPAFNERSEMKLLNKYASDFVSVDSLKNFIEGTQLAQICALRHKLERARCRWPAEVGIMYYKLNDVYIGGSWSVIDWYGVPKPAHYFIQDAYSPVHACILIDKLNFKGEKQELPVFLLDDAGKIDGTCRILVRAYNEMLVEIKRQEYNLVGNRACVTNAGSFTLLAEQTEGSPILIVCEIEWNKTNNQRTFYWLNYAEKPGCLFQLPRTTLEYQIVESVIEIRNTGELPAVAVGFQSGMISDTFRPSDSYFWLDSGECRRITVNRTDFEGITAWNA